MITSDIRPRREVKAAAQAAVIDGAALPRPRVAARDLSWECESPVLHTLDGREPQSPQSERANANPERVWLDTVLRCNRCSNCLRWRSWQWAQRATREISASRRTWFGTITLRPEARYRALALRDKHATADASERFSAIHGWASEELTKAFKRLRKEGHAFRYLLVAERHADGDPHYHMLVHEHCAPIPKRDLEKAWIHGFTKWKLVDTQHLRTARYVAKYLSKDAEARVRASVRYGIPPLGKVSNETCKPTPGI